MRVHLHLRREWVTTTFDSQRRREALKGLPISCAAILASGLPSVSAAGSCEVGFAKLGVWLPVGSASFRKCDLSGVEFLRLRPESLILRLDNTSTIRPKVELPWNV